MARHQRRRERRHVEAEHRGIFGRRHDEMRGRCEHHESYAGTLARAGEVEHLLLRALDAGRRDIGRVHRAREFQHDDERGLVLIERRPLLLPGRPGGRDGADPDQQRQRVDGLQPAPPLVADDQMVQQMRRDQIAPARAHVVATQPDERQQHRRDQ
jgi:hypothetical protein